MQGSLSARRRELILLAYDQFDVDDSGEVNLEDMRAAYDTSHHPEVQGGSKTSDEVLTEFLGGFEGPKKDGTKSSHGGMHPAPDDTREYIHAIKALLFAHV